MRWHEKQVLDKLSDIAARDPKSSGGLLLLVDEMGKFLEGAARDMADVYFFQQLAEIASRSSGRLIVVGILHQAFDEYSHRLSREMREEWGKIQGRFIDLPVNTGVDEQIALLGKAIESDHESTVPSPLSESIAALTNRAASEDVPQLLESCWPLHPNRRLPVRPHIPPQIRPEPAQYFRLPKLYRAAGIPGFPAQHARWGTLSS